MIVVLFIVEINKRKSKINTTEKRKIVVRQPETEKKTCRKYELLVSLCNDDDDNNHMINHY